VIAGRGKRARDEQDQVVGARAEDDVLRRDPGVVRDRSLEPRVTAVRVRVDAPELVEQRVGACRWQRLW